MYQSLELISRSPTLKRALDDLGRIENLPQQFTPEECVGKLSDEQAWEMLSFAKLIIHFKFLDTENQIDINWWKRIRFLLSAKITM